MFELISNSIISLIDTCLLYIFVNLFMPKRDLIKIQRISPFLIVQFIHILSPYFISASLPRIVLFFICDILFCFIQFKDVWYKYIYNIGLFYILNAFIEVFSLLFFNKYLGISAIKIPINYEMLLFCIVLIVRLIILMLILLIKNLINHPIHKIKGQIFLIMPILTISFMWFMFNRYLGMNNSEIDELLTYVSIFFAIQNIFIFFYVASLQSSTKQYIEMKAAYERQKQYSATIASIQKAIRKMAHDIRHHFIYLMSALDQEDIPKAKSYLKELDDNLDNMVPLNVTGHYDIDVLLHAKARLAEKLGVTIKVQGTLPPEIIISPIDLNALLGNSLDNAMDAASRVNEQKEIVIAFGYNASRLNYSISNPYIGQIRKRPDGYFRSTKFNGGLGVEIMHDVVNKYNGVLLAEYDEEKFTLTAMLQLRDSIHKDDEIKV